MLVVILKKLCVIYILLFGAVVIIRRVFGGSAAKGASSPVSDTIVVRGKIAERGEEPNACPYLTMENGVEYKLIGDCRRELGKRPQGQIISLKGKPQKETLGDSEAPAVFYVTEIIKDY